jgi:hypothetical protein
MRPQPDKRKGKSGYWKPGCSPHPLFRFRWKTGNYVLTATSTLATFAAASVEAKAYRRLTGHLASERSRQSAIRELMNKPDRRLNSVALITGFLLIPARLILMFFPAFNLTEMMLFAIAAFLLAYFYRVRPTWWVALLFLPVCLFVLFIIVAWLGMDNLRQGTGVGHVVSLVLIPLSAFAGAHYAGRLAGASLKVQL